MNIIASIIVVTNLGFTAAFDTSTRCPSWVAYDLEPSEVVTARRMPIGFSADPRIRESAVARDYVGRGYDRGHLCPAADCNWSEAALRQTYYFSNIVPQLPSANRGEWARIEAEVRSLAASGTVHIVIIPVGSAGRIGRVNVPRKMVKVAWGSFGARIWEVGNK